MHRQADISQYPLAAVAFFNSVEDNRGSSH